MSPACYPSNRATYMVTVDVELAGYIIMKVSRATPTIVHDGDDHDLLIIGVYGPAFVIAVKRSTGKLVWSTQLDHNPAAVITMLDLVAFEEEETGELPLMKRGSMQILSTQTGKNFTLKPSNKTATSGGWVAMDARNGKTL
ncbi:hypothetical protein ACOSQ2_030238 [Xanthoceras sorbifolium]